MTAEISACAPPGISNFFGIEGFASCDLTRNLVAIKNCLAKYPESAAKRDEDAGDALAALDYEIMSYIKGDRRLSCM
ncbi:hypothetical protein D9619_009398 [Psilocybe cf. subviscida]|uniref:Uncharacterized protein n=1 Tax=Psilocybe cf. subviscida TaxID=2480587 RepID=A0A8H5FA44_9AGAR|nr:hypothetical protein D9619_009398 [Psilocybe cf. subviscida]